MMNGLYWAGLAAALVIYLLLFFLGVHRQHLPVRFFALACILSAMSAFCLSRGNVFLFGGFMTRMRGFLSLLPYDHSMMGTLLGIVLGTAVAAFITKVPVRLGLDVITPASLAAVVIARFAEGASDFGWGALVFEPQLQFFPLCIADMYNQFHLAVFLFEGLAALCIFCLMPRTSSGSGCRFWISACRFMLAQIFLESLRAETLRIGFVRVQQVECAVLLLLMALLIPRNSRKMMIQSVAAVLIMVGVSVFAEFALDKITIIPAPAVYLLLCSALTGCGVVLCCMIRHVCTGRSH
ncbi:MAG: hypothetical protein IJ242_05480 [Clostridia bacterium]|nr:hypothetical protein [Clostridia bacterium]